MRKSQFLRLPEFETEADTSGLKIGDKFLYGRSVILQKQNKIEGQEITYYEVINKSQNGIEYGPVYDYMEKDKGDERDDWKCRLWRKTNGQF